GGTGNLQELSPAILHESPYSVRTIPARRPPLVNLTLVSLTKVSVRTVAGGRLSDLTPGFFVYRYAVLFAPLAFLLFRFARYQDLGGPVSQFAALHVVRQLIDILVKRGTVPKLGNIDNGCEEAVPDPVLSGPAATCARYRPGQNIADEPESESLVSAKANQCASGRTEKIHGIGAGP